MNRDKQNFGPESPADLQWSQGAKNTWRYFGTSTDDTNNHNRFDRASKSETMWTSQYEDQSVSRRDGGWVTTKTRNATWASKGETMSTFEHGPPKGDTNRYHPAHSQIRENATITSSSMNVPLQRQSEGDDKVQNERSRLWYINLIKNKSDLMEEFYKNPKTTAIAVNFGDDSGHISSEQRTLLTNDIINQVYKYEVPDIPKAFVPKFLNYKYIAGYLIFKCFDIKTAHWLTTLNFSNLWRGANIEILVEGDFSKLVLCNVLIPKPILDPKDIFHILKLQNKEICTKRWRLIEMTEQHSEILLHIALDETSLNFLKKCNMKLHYGVGKVDFYLLSQHSDLAQYDTSIDDVINPKPSNYDNRNTNIPQKDHIESLRNTTRAHNQATLPTTSKNINPTIEFQQTYTSRFDSPEKDISESYSPYERHEHFDKRYRSESPDPVSQTEHPDDLYRSESPSHLYRSASPTNFYTSASPGCYERLDSSPKDYSDTYADPYQEDYYDPHQRSTSPQDRLSRDSTSLTRDTYQSSSRHIDSRDQISPHRYRDTAEYSRRSRDRSLSRGRDRDRRRDFDRSLTRRRSRSPSWNRDRSPRSGDREQARSPPRSRGNRYRRSPDRRETRETFYRQRKR